MYHYYVQKNPPKLSELINCSHIEKVFFHASMELEIEQELERLEARGF